MNSFRTFKILKNHNLLQEGEVFKNLRLVPESMVLTADGRIVTHNWKGLLKILLTYKKISLTKGTTFLVVHTFYRGYYHWLLECIPKILMVRNQTKRFTLLVPEYYKRDSFYADSLEIIGVTDVEYMMPKVVYKVPKLIVPYYYDPLGSFTPQIVKNLRAVLQKELALTEAYKDTEFNNALLYVSRKNALRRKVVNEDSVEKALLNLGFKVICLEDYTFREQIKICSSARAIVGIHGAGLANILFIPPGSLVIELRKQGDTVNYTYERLAKALDLDYELQYCRAIDPSLSVQDADIEVDVQVLKNLLKTKLG